MNNVTWYDGTEVFSEKLLVWCATREYGVTEGIYDPILRQWFLHSYQKFVHNALWTEYTSIKPQNPYG